MSDLNLLYTDIEDDLRKSVRGLLADRCDPAAVLAVYDGDRSLVGGLWKALSADLGLAGLLVPEAHGGGGASAREAAVVLEELGRSVAPVPFLTSAVVATTVLLDSDSALLGSLAAGDRRPRWWCRSPRRRTHWRPACAAARTASWPAR